MIEKESASLPLILDENAQPATPGKPAFLSRPSDAPLYHGFPLIEETRNEGWCYGAITEFTDPEGFDHGDGFVEAPDGTRAGLVWEVGNGEVTEIIPPEKGRWGVYAIWFPRRVKGIDDLISNFHHVLPQLVMLYEALQREEK